jgi:4-amino-4-deoxy-L-arabinose transferase-like glycosyltransferase
VVTLAALAVRVVFVLWEPANRIAGDEITWTTWAIGAREGLLGPRVHFSPFRWELIFYPPLYPYFIAAWVHLLGSLTAVKWAQALVAALLVPAVGRLGEMAFGRRAGLLAAMITAAYPELVWYTGHFWSEILFLTLAWWGFERLVHSDQLAGAEPAHASSRLARVARALLPLAVLPAAVRLVWGHDLEPGAGALYLTTTILALLVLWWLSRSNLAARDSAMAAGLLFGLAILTRETLLYFTPLAALWLARREARARPRAVLFLAAVVLVVAPWTYRNYVVTHALVPVATSGSLNLWQGNTRLSRDEVYRRSDAVRGPGHVRVAQRRYQQRMAVQAILARQPWWVFEKLASEMPRFWEADSLVLIHLAQKRAYGQPKRSTQMAVAVVVLAPYLLVLALALWGGLRMPWGRPAALLLGFLVFYNGLHVVSHGFSRYRLPVLPVVFLVAGCCALPALRRRSRIWRRVLVGLAAGILALSLVPSLKRRAAALRGTAAEASSRAGLVVPQGSGCDLWKAQSRS